MARGGGGGEGENTGSISRGLLLSKVMILFLSKEEEANYATLVMCCGGRGNSILSEMAAEWTQEEEEEAKEAKKRPGLANTATAVGDTKGKEEGRVMTITTTKAVKEEDREGPLRIWKERKVGSGGNRRKKESLIF